MLRLVLRRAWVQRRLLSAVVLLVAVTTTLLGFYALLIGVTGPRAFSEQVQQSPPGDVDVTAYVADVAGSDLVSTRNEARGVVDDVLGPLDPSVTSIATSQLRQLGDSTRLGYLATVQGLDGQMRLTSGRWPRAAATGSIEAVAPDAAARALHLHVGSRIPLGPGAGLGESQRRATVVVVGTFRGLPPSAAESDPLSGAGADSSYASGGVTAPTYGPFLVGETGFLATGFDVDRLRVDAQPDLAVADDAALSRAVGVLGGASALLSDRLGDSAGTSRVGSALPVTLGRLHTQQASTRSAVLIALALDAMLGLAALLLAGRLLADVRAEERDLLSTLGLGPGQQVASALLEALLLAVATVILAVPAATAAYAGVTHLPDLRAARLTEAPTLTPGLLATTTISACVLAAVLVLAPLVRTETGRLSGRRGAWARAGADVLLLVVAGVGWWQVHQRPATGTGGDTLLVLAPVLSLAAVTAVVVRSLPPLFALVSAAGSRSRALLPVSLHPTALHLRAGAALVLLSLAAASATFGVALHATWQRSQEDQADLRVGTDLSLTLDAPPTAEDAAAVAHVVAETGRSAALVSPDVDRPVALGQYFGDPGEPPELIALDTRHADSLLRGRLADGATWSDVGDRLTPSTPAQGLRVPSVGVTARGRAPAGAVVSVTPSLVLQDVNGFRSTLAAAPFPMDGRPHPLHWTAAPASGDRVVAIQLAFADLGSRHVVGGGSHAEVSVVLRLPGAGPDVGASGGRWQARHLGDDGGVLDQSVSERRARGAAVLTTGAQLNLPYLQYTGGDVLATAFAPPLAVPVAVSQELVDATGTKVGQSLSATVGDTEVPLRVVDIVPTVPSAPGRIAVLADADTVSRALIVAGHLEPVVDGFWVSEPGAQTAPELRRLGLGDVTTRDETASELTSGPMQVTQPVAYVTVVVSAVLLLLTGAVLMVSADQRRRTADVARLRALGLSRGGARRLVLAQHGAVLLALVLTGTLIGGGAALALDRSLVRSDQGTAPVPPAVLAWPWGLELLITGGLVLACLVIAAWASAAQVRRADPTQLRSGESE